MERPTESDADEHDWTDAGRGLDFTMNAETYDHAMKHDWNNDGLEDESDQGRDIEMWGILHVGLPADRKREQERVKREHVEQRVEPILIEHHQAHEHEAAGQEVRNVKCQTVHL